MIWPTPHKDTRAQGTSTRETGRLDIGLAPTHITSAHHIPINASVECMPHAACVLGERSTSEWRACLDMKLQLAPRSMSNYRTAKESKEEMHLLRRAAKDSPSGSSCRSPSPPSSAPSPPPGPTILSAKALKNAAEVSTGPQRTKNCSAFWMLPHRPRSGLGGKDAATALALSGFAVSLHASSILTACVGCRQVLLSLHSFEKYFPRLLSCRLAMRCN